MTIMVANIPLLKSLTSTDIKQGLPSEVWRVVFSYLKAIDLCRCSQVCKDWRILVDSVDATTWRFLYLEQKKYKRWKHPYWPNETQTNVISWKKSYRQRYLVSRLWLNDGVTTACSVNFFFGRSKERKNFYVGSNKPYKTIKSAIEKASPYDRIYVYPGVYQDPVMLVIKNPCAIIGVDDPSKIILTMQIDVRAESLKLENLTIKPMYPRRVHSSTALLKVLYGHVFMFNCIVNQGYLHITAPGIVDIRSCTFTTAFVNLQGVGYSSITNCEFKPDRFAIFVEEPLFQFHLRPPRTMDEVGGWVAALNEKKFDEYYCRHIKEKCRKRNGDKEMKKSKSFLSCITESDLSLSDSDASEVRSKTKSCLSRKSRVNSLGSLKSDNGTEKETVDAQTKVLLKAIQGVVIRNIKVTGGKGGVTLCRMGQAWIENSTFSNLSYGIRCLQNSKCVVLNNKIHSCDTTGIFIRDHSVALIAGNQIFANGEAGIDIRSSANPLIEHNEIHSGRRSGIVCLDHGKGVIRENDIYNNKEAGIYILHKGCPKIHNNHVWSGRAAGIAVTEDGTGHITNNIITGMEWAGIDIRHGGNPVISHNVIQHGKSDGIVVGEAGKSVILDNTIEENSGCGIWILDGSHPLIHSNVITNSGNSGIAFVNNSDHEHEKQKLSVHIPQNRAPPAFNHDADERSVDTEEEFIFPSPMMLEQEPESRYVHVSKPDKKVAQIEGNTIENNKGHGILYDGKEGIVIFKNQINHNLKHGINLIHSSEISIQDNELSHNHLSGVNVELGINVSLEGNGLYENGEYGVSTAGISTILRNDVFGHSLPGVYVQTLADVSLKNNRLHGLKHPCVHVEEQSRCIVDNNDFYIGSEAKDLYFHEISDVSYLDNNKIHKIDNNDSCRDLSDIVSYTAVGITDWRPQCTNMATKSAPFFTTVQMHNQNRSNNRSSFCALL